MDAQQIVLLHDEIVSEAGSPYWVVDRRNPHASAGVTVSLGRVSTTHVSLGRVSDTSEKLRNLRSELHTSLKTEAIGVPIADFAKKLQGILVNLASLFRVIVWGN